VRVHEGKAYLGVSVNEVTLMGGGQAREERRDDDRGYQPSGGGRGSSALDDEIPF
jgi:hypothetical protein